MLCKLSGNLETDVKYVIQTHAPVTAEQAKTLRDMGIDVDNSAAQSRFQGSLSPDNIALLDGFDWVKAVEPIILRRTC